MPTPPTPSPWTAPAESGWYVPPSTTWNPPTTQPAAGYGYPNGYPPPWALPPKKTNTLAIVSLVCAVTPFLLITPLVAAVTGHIARRRIQQSNEGGSGIAIAGEVVGGVFSLLIIAAIAIPVFLAPRHPNQCRCADTSPLATGLSSVQVGQLNASRLATDEETYRSTHGTYTNSVNELAGEGFYGGWPSVAGVSGTLAFGKQAYCVVAAMPSGSSSVMSEGPAYLYDNFNGGLNANAFPTGEAAMNACSEKVKWGQQDPN